MKLEDWEWYQEMITHHVAVAALVNIAQTVYTHGTCHFSGPNEPGWYDRAVLNMEMDIRHLVEDAKKYRELRKLLQEVVK